MATTTEQERKQCISDEHQEKTLKERAVETASNVSQKAMQAGTAVRESADDAVSNTGRGTERLADRMREKGPHGGMFGRANEAVADTLDRTGEYLEEKGLSGMAEDMTNVIRRHPLPAVLISVGVGFMLARLTSSRR